jgi:hypothetical protein
MSEQTTLRSVAVPSEHGGWSITLEPVLLGLIVAPTVSGFALGAAALLAFVARTPLKIVLVDRWRGRRIERTRLATQVVIIELIALAALVGVAIVTAQAAFWWPLVVAAPLIAVELWHDMRSRSRRLVPELAGSVGIAAVAAAIALAGGESTDVAAGLWIVVGARSIATVPFIRVQLLRFKGHPHATRHSDLAQVAAVAIAGSGVALGLVPLPAALAIAGLALFELVAVRRPPRPAAVLGAQQVVLGLTVVLITGLSVVAP